MIEIIVKEYKMTNKLNSETKIKRTEKSL